MAGTRGNWASRACRRAVGFAVALAVACVAGPTPAAWAATTGDAGQAATGVSSQAAAGQPLRVVLFFSRACPGCDEALEALACSAKRWGPRIRTEARDIGDLENFRELFVYEEHYGAGEDKALKAFIGRRYLVGSGAIVRRLDEVMAAELPSRSVSMRFGLAHGG